MNALEFQSNLTEEQQEKLAMLKEVYKGATMTTLAEDIRNIRCSRSPNLTVGAAIDELFDTQ